MARRPATRSFDGRGRLRMFEAEMSCQGRAGALESARWDKGLSRRVARREAVPVRAPVVRYGSVGQKRAKDAAGQAPKTQFPVGVSYGRSRIERPIRDQWPAEAIKIGDDAAVVKEPVSVPVVKEEIAWA